MTKKELQKRKGALAYQISNIKKDFSDVAKEDLPEEIVSELHDLMEELKSIRSQLDEKK